MDDTITPEISRRGRVMNDLCRQVRGVILNEVALLEAGLSYALSRYFCNNRDRRGVLFSEVFSGEGQTLFAKAALFQSVCRKEMPDFEAKHAKIRKRIDEVREFRNTLAHAQANTAVDVLKVAEPQAASFVTWDHGVRGEVLVTEMDLNDWVKKIRGLEREVDEISPVIALRE